MFKVLILAYYFPPMGLSGVQRTLKFVKYMKNYNWEPTVITAGDVGYFAHDHSLLKEVQDAGIKIIRTEANDPNSLLSKFGTIKPPSEFVRKIINRLGQTFFIPDNKISWSKKAYKKSAELIEQEHFDVLFITCPPFSAFYFARKLKKKFNIPIVVDYRDLWYGSYYAFYPTPVHRLLHKRMEYNALKSVDKIIVTNRRIKEKLIKFYNFLTFEDVTIISHGYDPEDFQTVLPVPKPNDKMIITYSGIFIEYNTPKYFLTAFKRLSTERPDVASKIELHFAGYLGKENEKLVKRLRLEEYVRNYGYIDHKEAIRKTISSDIVWIMVGKKRNIDAILPGKLYEYIGAKKPIIGCIPEGVVKNALNEYGASFITEPEDIEGIKNTLLKVYELYLKKELPIPDDNYILKYRRDYLTEQLTKQFQLLVKTDII
jgi:glycosyltransferase involved in cell wall biosynthesis